MTMLNIKNARQRFSSALCASLRSAAITEENFRQEEEDEITFVDLSTQQELTRQKIYFFTMKENGVAMG